MIKSEHGEITINGTNGDIALEFLALFDELYKVAPEIVNVVVSLYTKDLLDNLDKADAEVIAFLSPVLKAVKNSYNK